MTKKERASAHYKCSTSRWPSCAAHLACSQIPPRMFCTVAAATPDWHDSPPGRLARHLMRRDITFSYLARFTYSLLSTLLHEMTHTTQSILFTTIQKCYLTKIPLKGLWCPQISIQLVVYISNKHRLQERDHMTITWHTARHTPITWFYRLLHDYHMHALKQKDRTYFSSPPSFLKHSDVFLMSWVQ